MIFNLPLSFLGFMVSLLISIYLSYCIYFIMVCFAFWFGEVRSIVVAYNLGMIMISGQYIPIRLFPENFLSVISWTPVPYLVDLPVSIATGLSPFEVWKTDILYALIWCVVLTIISLIFYKSGVKNMKRLVSRYFSLWFAFLKNTLSRDMEFKLNLFLRYL